MEHHTVYRYQPQVCAAAREIITGRDWRSLKVLIPVSVLALANIGFHAEAYIYVAVLIAHRGRALPELDHRLLHVAALVGRGIWRDCLAVRAVLFRENRSH